jgi:hypothetical protein
MQAFKLLASVYMSRAVPCSIAMVAVHVHPSSEEGLGQAFGRALDQPKRS